MNNMRIICKNYIFVTELSKYNNPCSNFCMLQS
nr:MAG TPA: hypothetical protein [Caudoviricetes sp.]